MMLDGGTQAWYYFFVNAGDYGQPETSWQSVSATIVEPKKHRRSIQQFTMGTAQFTIQPDPGGMAEWLKAAVLKTVSRKWDVGSNPTPSAKALSL